MKYFSKDVCTQCCLPDCCSDVFFCGSPYVVFIFNLLTTVCRLVLISQVTVFSNTAFFHFINLVNIFNRRSVQLIFVQNIYFQLYSTDLCLVNNYLFSKSRNCTNIFWLGWSASNMEGLWLKLSTPYYYFFTWCNDTAVVIDFMLLMVIGCSCHGNLMTLISAIVCSCSIFGNWFILCIRENLYYICTWQISQSNACLTA